MTKAEESTEADAVVDTSDDVIDTQGFADLTHIPKATLLTLRSRAPSRLPPPFCLRPLRWRRQTVLQWMEAEEQSERDRIEKIGH